MDPVCEAYLYASARAHSLRKVVKPVLDAGGIVVSDRSFVTSLAYQAVSRKLGAQLVMKINKPAIGEFYPDLIIYFDLDPEIGYARTFDHEGDKFENEKVGFFKKAYRGYMKASRMSILKNKWINIDASGSIDEVFEKVLKAVSKRIR